MRISFAIVAFVAIAGCSLSAYSQQTFEHRSQGLINDGFMSADGTRLWTAEDGGRIRYRDPWGSWTYQDVYQFEKDTIHRIFFLDDNLTGWAVGQDGHVLNTTTGGVNGWNYQATIVPVVPVGQYEELYDVHFLDASRGWLVGIHGIWYWGLDSSGLGAWLPARILDASGTDINLMKVSLYAIDVVERSSGIVALVCGQPGYVLRNVDPPPAGMPAGSVFQVVWDVASVPASSLLPCELGALSGQFAGWDIEISRNGGSENPFALMVGGVGTGCGLAFSSVDDGVTWVKEHHECEPTAGGASPCTGLMGKPYEFDINDLTHKWRLQSFRTLYGLGLFDDRSAVAGGYNGQHVIRDPSTGVWHDRSSPLCQRA